MSVLLLAYYHSRLEKKLMMEVFKTQFQASNGIMPTTGFEAYDGGLQNLILATTHENQSGEACAH
jgi:hypothetical protein